MHQLGYKHCSFRMSRQWRLPTSNKLPVFHSLYRLSRYPCSRYSDCVAYKWEIYVPHTSLMSYSSWIIFLLAFSYDYYKLNHGSLFEPFLRRQFGYVFIMCFILTTLSKATRVKSYLMLHHDVKLNLRNYHKFTWLFKSSGSVILTK